MTFDSNKNQRLAYTQSFSLPPSLSLSLYYLTVERELRFPIIMNVIVWRFFFGSVQLLLCFTYFLILESQELRF